MRWVIAQRVDRRKGCFRLLLTENRRILPESSEEISGKPKVVDSRKPDLSANAVGTLTPALSFPSVVSLPYYRK